MKPGTREVGEMEDGGIDAGLLMLELLSPPGRRYTVREIAEVCGTSRGTIFFLERSARKKIEEALARRGLRAQDLIG